jgi:hypothetical protein
MFRKMPVRMLLASAVAGTAVAAEPSAAPAAANRTTTPAIEHLNKEGVIHRDLAARSATAASTTGAAKPCGETDKPKAAAGGKDASAKPACNAQP